MLTEVMPECYNGSPFLVIDIQWVQPPVALKIPPTHILSVTVIRTPC